MGDARRRREMQVLIALLDSKTPLNGNPNRRVRKALEDSNGCERAARVLLRAQVAAFDPAHPMEDPADLGRPSGREDGRFDPRFGRIPAAQKWLQRSREGSFHRMDLRST